MAVITVRAKAHTAAPIWATSYLKYPWLINNLLNDLLPDTKLI